MARKMAPANDNLTTLGATDALEQLAVIFPRGNTVNLECPHLGISLAAIGAARTAFRRLGRDRLAVVNELQRFVMPALRNEGDASACVAMIEAVCSGAVHLADDEQREAAVARCQELAEADDLLPACMAVVAELACWSAADTDREFEYSLGWCVKRLVELLAGSIGEHASHELVATLAGVARRAA